MFGQYSSPTVNLSTRSYLSVILSPQLEGRAPSRPRFYVLVLWSRRRSTLQRGLDFPEASGQLQRMKRPHILHYILLFSSIFLLGCTTTNSTRHSNSIPMPSVSQNAEGQEYIEFEFTTAKHGTQTVHLHSPEDYDAYPGSRQWRGSVKNDPSSKVTFTQYKTKVFITIKSPKFGNYEIRGEANDKLKVLELRNESYLSNGLKPHSQFGHGN